MVLQYLACWALRAEQMHHSRRRVNCLCDVSDGHRARKGAPISVKRPSQPFSYKAQRSEMATDWAS